MTTDLIHFDRARQELALATKIDQVKTVRDKAEAIRLYIRQQGASLEMQNQCAEIKLRAERRAGEILADEIEHEGGRPEKLSDDRIVSAPKLTDLGISLNQSSDWQCIARMPEDVLEKHIVETKDARKELTTAGTLRLARRLEMQTKRDAIDADEADLIQGVYDVIVIDPPWPMEKIEREVRPNQVGFDYPTMSEDALTALEIPVADNCHIWLWTTQRFLPMALRMLTAWGLKYVCTFVWHKCGGFQAVGLPQYNLEFAIYARKGSPKFIDTKNFFTCFEGKRHGHSCKPDSFYEMVARVTSGRRLDMFNRRKIEGFKGWGLESP